VSLTKFVPVEVGPWTLTLEPAYAIDALCHDRRARLQVRSTTTALTITVEDELALLDIFTSYLKGHLATIVDSAHAHGGQLEATTFGLGVTAGGSFCDIDPSDVADLVAQLTQVYEPSTEPPDEPEPSPRRRPFRSTQRIKETAHA